MRHLHHIYRTGDLTPQDVQALQMLQDEVNRLKFSAAPPLTITEDSGGVRIALQAEYDTGFWARITGAPGGANGASYPFVEQYQDNNGVLSDMTGGRSGTVKGINGAAATVLPAVPVNGSKLVYQNDNPKIYVRLFLSQNRQCYQFEWVDDIEPPDVDVGAGAVCQCSRCKFPNTDGTFTAPYPSAWTLSWTPKYFCTFASPMLLQTVPNQTCTWADVCQSAVLTYNPGTDQFTLLFQTYDGNITYTGQRQNTCGQNTLTLQSKPPNVCPTATAPQTLTLTNNDCSCNQHCCPCHSCPICPTVPCGWQVQASGFTGSVSANNGTWQLTDSCANGAGTAPCTWINIGSFGLGNGIAGLVALYPECDQPFVQGTVILPTWVLVPGSFTWVLQMGVNTNLPAIYKCPAASFNCCDPTGSPNVFNLFFCPPNSQCPQTLNVVPWDPVGTVDCTKCKPDPAKCCNGQVISQTLHATVIESNIRTLPVGTVLPLCFQPFDTFFSTQNFNQTLRWVQCAPWPTIAGPCAPYQAGYIAQVLGLPGAGTCAAIVCGSEVSLFPPILTAGQIFDQLLLVCSGGNLTLQIVGNKTTDTNLNFFNTLASSSQPCPPPGPFSVVFRLQFSCTSGKPDQTLNGDITIVVTT